jgi:hypothetical protein
LLRQGAIPVLCGKDIVDEIFWKNIIILLNNNKKNGEKKV